MSPSNVIVYNIKVGYKCTILVAINTYLNLFKVVVIFIKVSVDHGYNNLKCSL